MAGPRIEGVDAEAFAGLSGGAFNDHLGMELDLISPTRVEGHLVAGQAHQQPYGIVHGGVYTAMVETVGSVAGAAAASADGMFVVGVSNATDFLRAHREGRLDAVATPIHVGRLQHVWQIDITRASDGKAVARGTLRLQVLTPDRVTGVGRDDAGDTRDTSATDEGVSS